MYTPLARTTITLQTQAVKQAGFGIPIFIGAHRHFPERVRSYVDLEGAQGDLPVGSPERTAVEAMFGQNPQPATVMIGRRKVDTASYTPDAATAIGQTYTISITGTDLVKVDAEVITATGTETSAELATALVAALGSVTGVLISDDTGSFSVAPATATDDYVVSNVSENIPVVVTATENAATVMQEITEENNDFYLVTAHDKTQEFILDMAADVEARKKLYFVAVQEADALTAISDPIEATDTLAKLQDLGYIQTAGAFYHDNDALFECGFVAKGAPYQAGTITWANQRVVGFTDAKDPATGKSLSTTQKGYVADRNATYTEDVGGMTITRVCKTAGGEYIDVIRSKDFLEARITEAYQNKLINSLKVSYDRVGINEMVSVLQNTLDQYVTVEGSPNILQADKPYIIKAPDSNEIAFATKASRILYIEFTGYLAGAIESVVTSGRLTLDAPDA
jgi:hypothetical protein